MPQPVISMGPIQICLGSLTAAVAGAGAAAAAAAAAAATAAAAAASAHPLWLVTVAVAVVTPRALAIDQACSPNPPALALLRRQCCPLRALACVAVLVSVALRHSTQGHGTVLAKFKAGRDRAPRLRRLALSPALRLPSRRPGLPSWRLEVCLLPRPGSESEGCTSDKRSVDRGSRMVFWKAQRVIAFAVFLSSRTAQRWRAV